MKTVYSVSDLKAMVPVQPLGFYSLRNQNHFLDLLPSSWRGTLADFVECSSLPNDFALTFLLQNQLVPLSCWLEVLTLPKYVKTPSLRQLKKPPSKALARVLFDRMTNTLRGYSEVHSLQDFRFAPVLRRY